MKKTLALSVLALFGAVALSGCSTVADKETTLQWAGHYSGTGLTAGGDGQPVEVTLDQYQCFAYFPKKQGALETGFYTLRGDVMELKTTGEGRTFYFRTTEPGTMELLDESGNPIQNPPEGCCTFVRD